MAGSTAATILPLDAALIYASTGWPVLPCHWTTPRGCSCGDETCKSAGKHPKLRHGCLDASTDEATIRGWWARWPAANVAIATGAPGPDVVDVDTKDGRDGYAALGRLRRAGLLAGPLALVRTPSGGAHLYYVGSDQTNGKLARRGIDFRSRGGLVVTPPSVIYGKPYELVEIRATGRPVDWSSIRRFLDPPPAAPPRPRNGKAGKVDPLARWLERQAEGNRNAALFWAACRAVETGCISEDDGQMLVRAATSTGLTETEARRTIASARRKVEGARS